MLSIARTTTLQLLGAWSWRLKPGKAQRPGRGLGSPGLSPGDIVDIELELFRENKRPDWERVKAGHSSFTQENAFQRMHRASQPGRLAQTRSSISHLTPSPSGCGSGTQNLGVRARPGGGIEGQAPRRSAKARQARKSDPHFQTQGLACRRQSGKAVSRGGGGSRVRAGARGAVRSSNSCFLLQPGSALTGRGSWEQTARTGDGRGQRRHIPPNSSFSSLTPKPYFLQRSSACMLPFKLYTYCRF